MKIQIVKIFGLALSFVCGVASSGDSASAAALLDGGRASNDQRCFHLSGQFKPRLKAVFKAGDDVRTQPLILPDGSVVVGSIDRNFYFLNPDGSLKYKITTNAGNQSTPALTTDQMVAIGSGDGIMRLISLDGRVLYEVETKGSMHCGATALSDGRVAIGSTDGNIYIWQGPGKQVLQFATGVPFYNSVLELADGTLVVAANDGQVYFLDPAGQLKSKLALSGRPSQPALNGHGEIVVGTTHGILYFLSADSRMLRQVSVPTVSDFGTPLALTADTFVVGSLDHTLRIFGPADVPVASMNTGGAYSGDPVKLNDQTFVSASNDNTLHFYTYQGKELVRLGPLGPLENGQAYMPAPSVANDGTVVVSSADGHVYFVETDPQAVPCNPIPPSLPKPPNR